MSIDLIQRATSQSTTIINVIAWALSFVNHLNDQAENFTRDVDSRHQLATHLSWHDFRLSLFIGLIRKHTGPPPACLAERCQFSHQQCAVAAWTTAFCIFRIGYDAIIKHQDQWKKTELDAADNEVERQLLHLVIFATEIDLPDGIAQSTLLRLVCACHFVNCDAWRDGSCQLVQVAIVRHIAGESRQPCNDASTEADLSRHLFWKSPSILEVTLVA